MARETMPGSLFASTLSAEPVQIWSRIKALKDEDIYDRLTGLYNVRHLAIAFHMELSRARRFDRKLSLALFDIDRLKSINNAHGRDKGDQVLADVGTIIAQRPREYDLAFRLTADEFLLVLPETGKDGCHALVEGIVAAVANESMAGLPIGTVTISGGYGEVHAADKSEGLQTAMERAHIGQVRTVSKGGNRVYQF